MLTIPTHPLLYAHTLDALRVPLLLTRDARVLELLAAYKDAYLAISTPPVAPMTLCSNISLPFSQIDITPHETHLDIAIDSELPGRECTNHEQTRRQARERPSEPQLLRNLDQSARGALTRQTFRLVDLAQHGVGGLRDHCSGEAGDEAGAEVDGCVHGIGGGGFVDEVLVGEFGDFFIDDEFGHCVGDSVVTCQSIQVVLGVLGVVRYGRTA